MALTGGGGLNIIFLGTNGWYDTDAGNTICILIQSRKYNIILDAGTGLYKVDRYSTEKGGKPLYLFLSHFHLDHIIGLHTLAKFNFSQGLTICGSEGSGKVIDNIINEPFTMPLSQLPYHVEILELPRQKRELPFKVDVKPLLHTSLTLGYRIEIDGKVISYCPDTGYCENAVELSRSADILIAECAFRSGESDENWPHLNPETAAKIANEAKAKKLVLVHFDAHNYKTLGDRKQSEKVARRLFHDTMAAVDDMQIEI